MLTAHVFSIRQADADLSQVCANSGMQNKKSIAMELIALAIDKSLFEI